MCKFAYKRKLLHLMSKTLRSKTKPGRIIVNRLAAVLKEEGILNKELAEKLDYKEATVSQWTTNTIQPSLSVMLRIALEINRDIRDLLVSTKEVDEVEKKKLLKTLAEMGEKSKRTGKTKK